MKRYVRAIVVAAIFVAALIPAAANAGNQVYLSVGTSLAAGTMAAEDGSNILFTNESYTDQLANKLVGVDHVKLGCPGETTQTFTNGGICYTGGSSQLAVAQSVIAGGNVAVVTIDMGANDFLQATPDILACGDDQACVFAIVSGIAADVGAVLDALQATDPTVPIVGMNYYNPNLAAWLGWFSGVPAQLDPDPAFAGLTNALAVLSNDLLEAQFAARGIPVVDVEAMYVGTDFGDMDNDGVPNNVERICKWTSMCPDSPTGVSPNIHATKRGYLEIAQGFRNVIRVILPNLVA